MSEIIVLGATGFVGGRVARALAGKHTVHSPSRAECDLTERASALGACASLPHGAALVIAAAVTPVKGAPLEGFTENCLIAAHACRMIEVIRPSHVTYLSTADVYGRTGLRLPLSEQSPARPEGFYAIAKFAGEIATARAAHSVNAKHLCLRLPGVYGPGDTTRPVGIFIETCLAGKPLTITGDGGQERDFLYVDDIARAIDMAIEAGAGGTYNLASGRGVSINRVLALISEAAGRKIDITYNTAAGAQPSVTFARSALANQLKGFEFTPIEDGIRATVAHYKEAMRG